MMKTIQSKFVQIWDVAGIIPYFLGDDNLTSSLAEILESYFTGGTAAKERNYAIFMGLVVGLIVFLHYIKFFMNRNSQKNIHSVRDFCCSHNQYCFWCIHFSLKF